MNNSLYTLVGLVAAATLTGLSSLTGCQSGATPVSEVGAVPAGLGLEPRFSPGNEFVPNPGLAEQLKCRAVWDGTGDMLGDRVTLTETSKDGTVPAELHEYAREVERLITSRFPDRAPIALNPDTSARGFGVLRAAEIEWDSVAFTRDRETDPSVKGVICDNAGVIMDFGDRYWTLSWNATRGELNATRSAMKRFMDSLTLAANEPSATSNSRPDSAD